MPDVDGLVLVRAGIVEIDVTAVAAIHVDLCSRRLGRLAGGIRSVIVNVQCVGSGVAIKQTVGQVSLDLADVLRGGIVVEAVIAITTVEVGNPGSALDDIVSGVALHRIGSGIAEETVVAGTSIDNVVANAAIDRVVAGITAEKVVPRLSIHHIVSGSAPNLVITPAAVELVVASIAVDGVGVFGADYGVVFRGTFENGHCLRPVYMGPDFT